MLNVAFDSSFLEIFFPVCQKKFFFLKLLSPRLWLVLNHSWVHQLLDELSIFFRVEFFLFNELFHPSLWVLFNKLFFFVDELTVVRNEIMTFGDRMKPLFQSNKKGFKATCAHWGISRIVEPFYKLFCAWRIHLFNFIKVRSNYFVIVIVQSFNHGPLSWRISLPCISDEF